MTRPEEVARTERLLVALDFDGTLSALVDDPMSARMTAPARSAVDALVSAPDTVVALVSGRSLGDLRIISEHAEDSQILLAASHGAEYWIPGHPADEAASAEDLALRDRLRREAEVLGGEVPGSWIEPKSFGFGVHTRTVRDADAAARLHAQVDALVSREAPSWRRRQGHNLVEYAFRTEGKDAAVARLRTETGATAVVFAGDDVTDEDALRSLAPEDLGIRVGPGETAAAVRVADTNELADLLTTIARERGVARQ